MWPALVSPEAFIIIVVMLLVIDYTTYSVQPIVM